ncbi:transposase [Amycolatopsis halotolerans]|uniref:transposase n=1 Tax=Amycolatopsis halotolerans TaxID=330083 RepID=UPI003620702D
MSGTGENMAAFATAGDLVSWIRVCPCVNESAGMNTTSHTLHGNANLKHILRKAATKQTGSYYAVYYRRIAARRGHQRALAAVMHKLAIAVRDVLTDNVTHHDLGAEYYTRRNLQRAVRQIVKQDYAFGLTVRFDPIPA